ncbi:MAG TPA: DUF3732 domain-containing protein [Candidatus Thermoplasmatota archaeon]|nr:DUF3732 domain-containing protein [Candidatus Thermoplasmatota archaeon]
MSWRLHSIAIYRRRTGERHTLEFRTDGLNIITGESGRGKSALIRIVDYCLLSDVCDVPKGIRTRVSHVGVRLTNGESQLAIVRALPEEGADVPSTVYMLERRETPFPSQPPKTEWTKDFAKDKLSAFTQIAALPIITNDLDSDAEKRYPPNIRHCTPFLFQPQNIIDNPEQLFPGLDHSFRKRAVADALPYFLRITTEAEFTKVRELRALRVRRNQIDRERKEQERLGLQGWERGRSLWSQAVALELLPGRPEPGDLGELIRILSAIPSGAEALPPAANVDLTEFEAEEETARMNMNLVRAQLDDIDRFLTVSEQSHETTAQQLTRLRFKDLLPEPTDAPICPLCGDGHVQADQIEQTLRHTVVALEATQSAPTRLRSHLETERESLRQQLQTHSRKASDARARREAALRDIAHPTLRGQVVARAELRGRVKEYVAAMRPSLAPPDSEYDELVRRIKELEESVGVEATASKLSQALTKISHTMTDLTERINVEYRGAPTRLNVNTLQVEVNDSPSDKRWTPLREIGSAANWVGYHVISVVGLHTYFREHDSPVPALIMIDQPSQAWFPPEVEWSPENPREDAETRPITKIVDVLAEFAEAPKGPQIIILEHAELKAESFKRNVLDRWTGAKGLLPSEWLADAEEQPVDGNGS